MTAAGADRCGASPRLGAHPRRPPPMTAAGADRCGCRGGLAGRHADGGLITLEWLLIVGAIAGLAATSVVAVQRVVDDTAEVPPDPLVRLLQADVAAAFVAAEAQAVFDAVPFSYTPADDQVFEDRCENGVLQDFSDVVSGLPIWHRPTEGADNTPHTDDDVPARCVVTPIQNLGG